MRVMRLQARIRRGAGDGNGFLTMCLALALCLALVSACDLGNASTTPPVGQRTVTPGKGASPTSSPTQDAPTSVYFGTVDYSRNATNSGAVYALNAGDGSFRWMYPLGQSANAPTLAKGALYVTGQNRLFVALSTITGKALWKTQTPNVGALIDNDTPTSPVVSSGVALVASATSVGAEGVLTAYSVNSGAPLWTVTSPATCDYGQAVADAAQVYTSLSPACPPVQAQAFTLTGGTSVWKTPIDAAGGYGSTLYDGTLYLNSFGDVYALRASDGALLWHKTLQACSPGDDSAPSVANGMLYVGGCDSLDALTLSDGSLVWSVRLGHPIYWTSVGDGAVFVNPDDGMALQAYNAQNGSNLWEDTFDNLIPLTPVVVNGVVYLSANAPQIPGGTTTASACAYEIVAVQAKSGAAIWKFCGHSGTAWLTSVG